MAQGQAAPNEAASVEADDSRRALCKPNWWHRSSIVRCFTHQAASWKGAAWGEVADVSSLASASIVCALWCFASATVAFALPANIVCALCCFASATVAFAVPAGSASTIRPTAGGDFATTASSCSHHFKFATISA